MSKQQIFNYHISYINDYCWILFVTSLREEIVLFEFDTLGTRVLIIHAHDQIAIEDIKFFTTVPTNRPAESPNHCKEEQTLQPHGYLLAGHLRISSS